MQWSSDELYEGQVTAFSGVASHRLCDLEHVKEGPLTDQPLVLVDTAGCEMEEAREEEGDSLRNEGEAEAVLKYVEKLLEAGVKGEEIGIITPYSAQVNLHLVTQCVGHYCLRTVVHTRTGCNAFPLFCTYRGSTEGAGMNITGEGGRKRDPGAWNQGSGEPP